MRALTEIDPRITELLPDDSDAPKTWKGAPSDRSPRRWSGQMWHDGVRHNVGTFDSPRQWGEARDELKRRLQREKEQGQPLADGESELDGWTIERFKRENNWPWNYPTDRRRADTSFAFLDQQTRRFVRLYGNRLIKGGIRRTEARKLAKQLTDGELSAVRALFNSAFEDDDTVANPFARLGRSKSKGRAKMPDVITAAEFELLGRCCLLAHGPNYGAVVRAAVIVAGTAGLRPGELWAMREIHARLSELEYFIADQVGKDGRLRPPKNGNSRQIIVPPVAVEALLAVPRLHPEYFITNKHGGVMRQSTWSGIWGDVKRLFHAELDETHWLNARVRRVATEKAALRAEAERIEDPEERVHQLKRIAAKPDGSFDFYELRHRAATYMAEQPPLGLAIAEADIALQLGHEDGGELVRTTYTHPSRRAALGRVKSAWHAAPGNVVQLRGRRATS